MKKILIISMLCPIGLSAQIKSFPNMDSLWKYVQGRKYGSGDEVLTANDTTVVVKVNATHARSGKQQFGDCCLIKFEGEWPKPQPVKL